MSYINIVNCHINGINLKNIWRVFMKKRIISLTLALLMCLCVNGTVMAQTNANESLGTIGVKSVNGLFSDLSKINGYTNRYTAWASVTSGLAEQITVGFALYRIVNNMKIYITSASSNGYGTYFFASKTVTLSAGTYKLYAYYEGETQSDSSIKTFIIN